MVKTDIATMAASTESDASQTGGLVEAIVSRVRGDRSLSIALAVAALLLIVDLAFISAHAAMQHGWIDTQKRLNLEQEGALPELWQHLKVLGIAGTEIVAMANSGRAHNSTVDMSG